MGMGINVVALTCRLGADPELKSTGSGMPICTVSCAFEQWGKDKEAGWVHVVCLDKAATNLAQYMRKGDEIGVTGRLSYRSWENQEGQKRNVLEIFANDITFLRKKGEGGGNGGHGGGADDARAQAYDRGGQQQEEPEDPFENQ